MLSWFDHIGQFDKKKTHVIVIINRCRREKLRELLALSKLSVPPGMSELITVRPSQGCTDLLRLVSLISKLLK